MNHTPVSSKGEVPCPTAGDLTITQACDRVYRYTVTGASACTPRDILYALRAVVYSGGQQPLATPGGDGAASRSGDEPYLRGSA